jgi:prevent-host-death family protein
MCHISVSLVKRTTIRELKHETTAVLRRVAAGETVEVCRRNEPVAILSPPTRRARVVRPDFAARLRAIYGNETLPTTGSDLVSDARGDR